MWGRGKGGACGEATKYTAGNKTSTHSIEKGAGAQQYIGHASKRHSIRAKRMENQKGDSNICGVWGREYKGTKTKENREQGFRKAAKESMM